MGIHSQHLHVHFTKVQCRTNSSKLYDVDYAQVVSWKTKIHGICVIFKQNCNLQYLHTSSTVQHWFRLSNHFLISQATPFTDIRLVWLIFRLRKGKLLKRRLGRNPSVVYSKISKQRTLWGWTICPCREVVLFSEVLFCSICSHLANFNMYM